MSEIVRPGYSVTLPSGEQGLVAAVQVEALDQEEAEALLAERAAAVTSQAETASPDLSKMTVAQLKALAIDRGATGTWKMTRAQILELLNSGTLKVAAQDLSKLDDEQLAELFHTESTKETLSADRLQAIYDEMAKREVVEEDTSPERARIDELLAKGWD